MMAMFNQAQGMATAPREQYEAPEGFADYRSQTMSRMNDRNSQGRPVYQPTQTFGGTLGQGGGMAGGGAPGGQPPGEGGMWDGAGGGPQQPTPNPMAGPQLQAKFGMPQGKPVDMSGGGSIGGGGGGMTKPAYGMGPPSGMPDIGGQTQPVGPDGKSLTAMGARLLGGQQTATPFRDAIFGRANPETGDRNTMRHIFSGGLQGSIGRGLGNVLANRENAQRQAETAQNPPEPQGRPMGGQSPAGSQLAQQAMLGQAFNRNYGVGSGGGIDRQLAAIGEQVTAGMENLGKPRKPGQKPGKPRGGLFKPAGSTSRGRAMSALGIGNQVWGAAQDSRALEDMNIHGRFIPEEQ
jgi:hypothetical protein